MAVSSGLIDTSVLVSLELHRRLQEAALPDLGVVSVITIGELRAGVLAATDPAVQSARLATLERVRAMVPLAVDDAVADRWAALRVALRQAGRRMPVNDSWIAATALAHGLTVYAQDADYDDVPGLSVVRV